MQSANGSIPLAIFVVGVMGFIVNDNKRLLARHQAGDEIFDFQPGGRRFRA